MEAVLSLLYSRIRIFLTGAGMMLFSAESVARLCHGSQCFLARAREPRPGVSPHPPTSPEAAHKESGWSSRAFVFAGTGSSGAVFVIMSTGPGPMRHMNAAGVLHPRPLTLVLSRPVQETGA
jgi:hypothetical protein